MDTSSSLRSAKSVQKRLWLESLSIAMIVLGIFGIYSVVVVGSISLLAMSQAVAGTAAIMIGMSFALSGLCFYFNFLDTAIVYRKYLGLIGFFLALIYSLMLLLVSPERYFYGFFDNLLSYDFILGLGAMAILTFMALISNNWALTHMGATRWRSSLRLGYVAYGMLAVRAYILEREMWLAWWYAPQITLPPPRLIVTIFAWGVIGLRIALMISKMVKHRSPESLPINKLD